MNNNNHSNHNDDFRDYWRKELHADEERAQEEQNDRKEQYWNGYDDHGFRNTSDPNYGPIPEEYESNAMSRAAYGCGIVSIICIFFNMVLFGGSFLVGALGIIFALLSRRNKFNRQARHAIRMCAIGMGVTVATVLLAIAILVQSGMWGSFMNYLGEIDPNDPNSVTRAQQELIEDLMDQYGLTGSGFYGSSVGSETSSSEAISTDSDGQNTETFTSGNGTDEII